MDTSSRSNGAVASGRSKGVSIKSSDKSKDSKTISKSEDEVSRKSKDSTAKNSSRKSSVFYQKRVINSKTLIFPRQLNQRMMKIIHQNPLSSLKHEPFKSGKSKLETVKTTLSKGKLLKSGGKIDVNGKVKSGLLKRKDPENDSHVSAGEVEDAKGNTSHSSKPQGSELKNGKKRQRN